jgi:hypothetical protein
MTLSKFDIFTFQMNPTLMTQLSLFDKQMTKDELMGKKNRYFNEIFNSQLHFYHRRFKLNYKIEYRSDDFILLRLANKKIVHIEQEFHRESFDSEPSCLVAIYNDPKTQQIAIESDKTSFGTSFTVVRVIEKAFEKELARLNLGININPKYEEKEFWELLRKYEYQIQGIRFEFEYPNLPHINKTLSDELKEASKSLNSETTKIEFSAGDKKVLDNLVENNEELSGLVRTSAAGGGPAKLKIKGLRRWESTDNKTKCFELNELEVDASEEMIIEYVREIKSQLKND